MTAIRREMLAFAKDVLRLKVPPAIERAGLRLVEQLAPKRARKVLKFQRQEREPKPTRKQLVEAVRPLALARSAGHCECGCGIAFGVGEYAPEWDEFYGRRPENVTLEKTWFLIRMHHRAKSENDPDRETWDRKFKDHCARHGYPFRARLTKALRRRAP